MSNSLFDLLKVKSSDDLKDKVQKVDEFVADDIEQKEKRDKYNVGKNISKIKTVCLWVSAVVMCFLLIGFIIALSYLFIIFIYDISKNIESTKELLKNWLDYILIILATLFVQNIFNRNS